MTAPTRQRKTSAWIAVTLASLAALVAIALSYPRTVAEPLLGSEWQCSRTLFMTSCGRVAPAKTAAHTLRSDHLAAWRP